MIENIVDGIQEKMVKYNVNGCINLLKSDNTKIELGLIFFNDVSIEWFGYSYIKMYSNLGTDGESIVSICNALNFEQKQICFVKKLERFGLLQCRNEKINDDK